MNRAQFRLAIEVAPPEELPKIRQVIYAAFGAGEISEDDAAAIEAMIELRTHVLPTERRKGRAGSRARTSDSVRRRRQFGSSAHMPDTIRAQFTEGERAALTIIALEVKRAGLCKLTVGEIAARAGVGNTTAKNALRRAQELGLIWVERRARGRKRNDPNTVRIIDPAWIAWLRIGRQGMREAALAVIAMTNQVKAASGTKTERFLKDPIVLRDPGVFGGPSSSGAFRTHF